MCPKKVATLQKETDKLQFKFGQIGKTVTKWKLYFVNHLSSSCLPFGNTGDKMYRNSPPDGDMTQVWILSEECKAKQPFINVVFIWYRKFHECMLENVSRKQTSILKTILKTVP